MGDMTKRIICLLLAVAFTVCLMPLGKGAVYAAGSDHQAQIGKMNALLNGLDLRSQFTQKPVDQWSDETVANAIYQKLCWDYQSSDYAYTDQFRPNPENYFVYTLSGLDTLTQSCYGRSFPRYINSRNLNIDGDKVYVDITAGDSVSLAVQDFYVRGDRVTAVGAAFYLTSGGPAGKFDGYFQAEFQKNNNSIYGYTLLSFCEIEGNQNFSKLTAAASSVLVEEKVTHYAPRVLDGKLNTAWVESDEGVGIGEWIQISNTSGKRMGLVGIELNLGYQIDQRRLVNNGWPTELLVECEGGYRQRVKLYYYDSVIILDAPVETVWVKLTILSATEGKEYTDTCISEIRLLGLDFEQMTPAEEPLPTQPPATTPETTEPPATTPKATQPPATTPKPTQPPATTPKPTQPSVTPPRSTQPAKPQATAPQWQSGDNQAAPAEKASSGSDNKIVMLAIIAVIVVTVVAAATMLLTAKKKSSLLRKANNSNISQVYPPSYPQNDPQNWQYPPQIRTTIPNYPKDNLQQPQQDSRSADPQNPWKQGSNKP